MSDADRQKHGDSCPECTIAPFTRNHYFTGKLMQVGDFDAEQRYGVDKLRLHDRILHGWGVACGLKVKQHPQAACQSRMVCIEPGVAVDCCGREIVLGAEDCVDITQLPAIKALIARNDTNAHVLQICIKYRECPTEEVPVFYDDRGCDGDRCAPNRILESYEFDAIIDPKIEPGSIGEPKLKWLSTINPGGANGVAVAAGPPGYLYAISANQSTVFQIETEHYSVVGTAPLPAHGTSLAVSPDGTRLYVVTLPVASPQGPSGPPFSLNVFDTSNNLSNPMINQFPIPESNQGISVWLAVGPDQRLLSLIGGGGGVNTGILQVWPTSIASSPPTILPDSQQDFHTCLTGLVISGDGKQAFAADSVNNQIAVLNIQPGTGSGPGPSLTNLPTGFTPLTLALRPGTGPELLAVAGVAGVPRASAMTLVAPAGGSPFPAVTLPNSPPFGQAVVVSPDGRWAYVLQQDGNSQGSIQAVDLTALQLQKTVTPGQPVPLGTGPAQVAISPTGKTLYVPLWPGPAQPQPGGIAVIDVGATDCQDLVRRSLDGCPDCQHPGCLVLATIERYQSGFAIEDQTDPPAAAATDTTNRIARIDNRKGRRLLPSVETLYELIECVETNVAGVPGPPGPPGPAGLQGPQGNPGQGLEQNLTQIKLPSWKHNSTLTQFPVITRVTNDVGSGIWITFTAPVNVAGLQQLISPDFVLQVLMRKGTSGLFLNEWKSINGVIFPVTVDTSGNATEVDMTQSPTPTPSSIAFYWTRKQGLELQQGGNQFLVRLRGDFVLDMNGKAVAAQFVRAALPTGQIPSGGPYAIEGGTFESWFQYKSPQSN